MRRQNLLERVIITGATSFIGMALIRKLIGIEKEVYAIIRPGSTRKSYLPVSHYVTVVEAELKNLDELQIPVDCCDILFHIGWSSDFVSPKFNLEGQMQNVVYAEKAANLAHRYGCHTFLSIGSQAECGQVNGCITADTPGKPQDAYGIAKLVTYSRLKALCEQYGMKFCWPRLLSAYGPFDRPHTLVMACMRACLENRTIELTKGAQIWDYIYVDDVAEALCYIAEHGKHAKKYPVGSGNAKSLRSYIEEIANITGNGCILRGIGKRAYAENQIMNLLADMSETQNDTGFQCKTEFHIGIMKTLEHMRTIEFEKRER